MTTRSLTLGALAALALCARQAWGSNPGTDTRAQSDATASGSTTICEGGTNPGATCSFSGDCTGGTCTGVANVRVAARGLLTIIADTKPAGVGWASTALPGTCTNPNKSAGTIGSCETKDNAVLTMLLEFSLNGKKYTFAESFTRLPDGVPCDPNAAPCDFLIPNWTIGLGSGAGWNQPAVESTLAERSLSSPQVVQIRWGGLPPAAESAVGAVLGRTGNQRVALSRTDDVPICTDTTPCKLSATNPRFSDHSDGTDALATVRRFKVDIAVIGP
jgi:hypothetical protein